MRLRRWIHHCKVAVVSIAVVAVAALLCGLLWLNENGFGGEWGHRIADELAERGIHAEFEEARFSPLHGIIVRNATVYFDQSRKHIFAKIPRLRIDIDRAKALRGELLLRQLVLEDASLFVPFLNGGEDPDPGELSGEDEPDISELFGEVMIDRQGRLQLRHARGLLAGMEFHLRAELDHFVLNHVSGQARGSADQARSEFLQLLFAELGNWSFPQSAAPKLDLRFSGNLEKPASLRTAFTFEAEELSRRNYTMRDAVLSGSFHGRHLSVKRFRFSDGAGEFTTSADYDLRAREGRYTVSSSIHLSRLLRRCFDNHALDKLVSVQPPRIEGNGDFRLAPDGTVTLGATGKVDIPRFSFQTLGSSFERLQTDFSWREDSIFLRNLAVTHRDGSLTGDVLVQGDTIRYRATSTLPASVFSPFIGEGTVLEQIVANCRFTPDSTIEIEAELGTITQSNLKEWASRGRATFTNVAYRGVPFRRLAADYDINPLEHHYTNIEAVFDYTNYGPRRRHGSDSSALVRADLIAHDGVKHLTTIKNLRGTAWPAPVLRLFAREAADHVEDAYRFRQPPSFVTSGTVGYGDEINETRVETSLRTHGTTDYTFLDRVLNLQQLSAQVDYYHHRVEVTDLKFRTFEGPVGGYVKVHLRPGSASGFEGGIHWTRLRLAGIGDTYGFAKADQGYVIGRFDFSGVSGNIRSLNGTGAIGLERGHLFYVPALGPLSTILGGILGDKRATHEQARDASCSFAVRNGVFHTRDFLTSTPSSVFTGEGSIDLQRKTIDMTIRMNARGILGLITLPLRPFAGLFQFKGDGPLRNPIWRSASFEPPAAKNDPIYRKPSRAVVVPERRRR